MTDLNETLEICQSWEEAQNSIRRYEKETNTKFAIYRKHISFNKPGKIDVSKHKIQFEDIKEVGKKQCINFTGIPFIVLGAKYLDCIYGIDRNITTKKKRFAREDELRKLVIKVTGDSSLAKKRRTVRDTKKVGCPASIIVRDIVFFPDYFAPKDTRWFRTETSKLLRSEFARDSSSIRIDRKFYVKFPSIQMHTGHGISDTPICVDENSRPVVPELSASDEGNEFDAVSGDHQESMEELSCEPHVDNEVVNESGNDHELSCTNETMENEFDSRSNEPPLTNSTFFNFTEDVETEESGCCISQDLAHGVRHVWNQGVEEDELRRCFERIKTPANCGFINAPHLHPHLQVHLSENGRSEEEKYLGHQMLLAKATNSLIMSLNLLNNIHSDQLDAETLTELKVQAESSFVCLSQMNLRFLHARKENLLASLNESGCESTMISVPGKTGVSCHVVNEENEENEGNSDFDVETRNGT